MKKKRTKQSLCLFFFLFLYATVSHISATERDQFKGPQIKSNPPRITPNYETSTVKLVWLGSMHFFSTFISPLDGPRSPSFPTGSAYGREAIQKKGFFMGIILTADRLLHESDLHLGPKIMIHGRSRYYDRVENNTFWWDQEKESSSFLDD